jgi:ABC-type Mn2+/Zn2+ transport system ATPase subunit
MQITNISIKNFRGLPITYVFNFNEKKNMLIYGENGSGKTSLFQAIKKFFETSISNTSITQFGNHFNTINKHHTTSHVSLTLSDQQIYTWDETSTPYNNQLIQMINKNKGCLDYHNILEVHYVHRFTNEINLYPLLTRVILANITNDLSQQTFIEDLMEIESMLNQSTPDIRKCTQLLQQYNSGFINILITLTNQANQFLDVFFKETRIEFRLSDYEQTPLQLIKKGSKYLLAEPQLFLDVWFADVKIENPHHFLNEARLSAIAISLYFAALTIMPPAPLSLLMLDDVLIGIDLANRMSVLKILTSHPFNQWQIILLTHDKIWYNIIQRYTSDLNTWACYEMYLDKQSRYPLTTIKPFKTALTLAKEHLQQNDLRAAALYTRINLEQIMRDYLLSNKNAKILLRLDSQPTLEELKTSTYIALQKTTEYRTNNLYRNKIDTLFSQVRLFKDSTLNSLVHEPEVQSYAQEIKQAIDMIEALNGTLNTSNYR